MWLYIDIAVAIILIIILASYFVFPFHNEWSMWGDCSKSCGTGSQSRSRTCKWKKCKQLEGSQDCNTTSCSDYYTAHPRYAIVARPVAKSFNATDLDDCLEQAHAGVDNNNTPFPSVDWRNSSKSCQLSMDTKDTHPNNYKPYGENTYYHYAPAKRPQGASRTYQLLT